MFGEQIGNAVAMLLARQYAVVKPGEFGAGGQIPMSRLKYRTVFDLDTTSLYARHEFGFKLAPGVKLNAGLDFAIAPYVVTARFPPPPRPGYDY